MANPKFLNVEKKVPYNLRLPQKLIDDLNAYADITGNTTGIDKLGTINY